MIKKSYNSLSLNSILLLVCSSILFSCATTHPGNKGNSTSPMTQLPLIVSAQTIENAKEEAFQLIEITLENKSDEWVNINNSKVLIDNSAEHKLNVVLGSDLKNWAQAMDLRLKRDNHNKEMAQLGILTAGTILAASAGSKSHNSELATLGTAAVIGTYAWVISDMIQQSYQSAEQSEKTPENHIYSPFSIPGKMFLRKWVLIQKPSHTLITKLALQIQTKEGASDTYEVKL